MISAGQRREFGKGVAIIVLIAALLTAAFSWLADRPDEWTWVFRVGAPILVVSALGVFLWIHFRPDEAPDYLREYVAWYFDRGGFCFQLVARVEEGICFLDAYFQNKYERPCVGRIVLRPGSGLLGLVGYHPDPKAISVALEIPCGPAAFGVATVALPIPSSLQGTRQKYEIGASVDYPEGHGRLLRFRDGEVIRTNAQFGNSFATAVTVAGALGGAIVISRPATLTIDLPVGVAEDTPEYSKPEIKTFWQLGDPILHALPILPGHKH
jgi:hypothetical protein